ncbi:FAD/NAD(P)-binding protein [Streptomyces sp. NPDC051173]|uniref:FAD/NAD(P)-binding protein n=1 Tax=Streptomyces sp. NPDC051173 TaxID=3155164 RepID=UPI00344BD720
MSGTRLDLCLIGAGPRGLSALERICANARLPSAPRPVAVHVVDPYAPGPGRVWRTGQPRDLLMNTVACQVTAFTDESVEMAGPRESGPSLYAWARRLSRYGDEQAGPHDAPVLAEARSLGPDSYPTRTLYGAYLDWVFHRVSAHAPAGVTVHVHRRTAVALDDGPTGTQTVTLDDGTRITGLHAVVLAQGHLPLQPSETETAFGVFAAGRGLTYLPPANPADVDLTAVAPGEPVLLRGLGLNFFDHMALLTSGRGGRFVRRAGRLVYLPSGREPRLLAGSRRGVPYHARGENEKGASGRCAPRLLTAELIAKMRAQTAGGTGLDFRTDLWPLVAREVETVYYTTLLSARGQGADAGEFRELYLASEDADGQQERLLSRFGLLPYDRWDWHTLERPYRDLEFNGPDHFHRWLADHLRADIAAARAGNVTDPLKAALDLLRDLRNEIRLAVDHGGLDGDSHRRDLDGWYTPLNAYLSIGPPARRTEELLALVEAGLVRIVGPRMRVWSDRPSGLFAAESPAVPSSRVHARALIEARLPETDLRRTADPLLRHLLATGQCRPYRIPSARGDGYETGGLAVTGRPYRVVDASGRAHPRRFAFGVPTEAVHWVTAAGIRPGVDSVTLADSDAMARAVLALDAPPHTDAAAPPTGRARGRSHSRPRHLVRNRTSPGSGQ